MCFLINSHNMGKDSQTHRMGKVWKIGSQLYPRKLIACGGSGKLILILFSQYGCFFPLDSRPMVYFITWEMIGFSCQFPKVWKIAGQPIEWEKPEKSISRKILQNPSYEENLGNWYSYFSHSMGAFFPLDSHSMVYFIICEIHGFPHQFPVARESAAKSIELGESRKLVPIFSLTYGHFSSIRFQSYGILYHMRNAWFFPSIFNGTGKCSKIHPVSFLVVFPQYYCFYLFRNLLIS